MPLKPVGGRRVATNDVREFTKDLMRNMTHAFGQFDDIYEQISR